MATPSGKAWDAPTNSRELERLRKDVEQIRRRMNQPVKIPPPPPTAGAISGQMMAYSTTIDPTASRFNNWEFSLRAGTPFVLGNGFAWITWAEPGWYSATVAVEGIGDDWPADSFIEVNAELPSYADYLAIPTWFGSAYGTTGPTYLPLSPYNSGFSVGMNPGGSGAFGDPSSLRCSFIVTKWA